MELFLLAGAVLPLTPNFSEGLVYTAFFYKMPFFILLVAACGIFGLMAVVFLLFIWRAVRRLPVLAINDTMITVLGMRPRTVNKADVVGLVRLWPGGGNINLQIRGQRPLALPVFLYTNPRLTMHQLEPLVSNPAVAAVPTGS